MKNSTQLAGAIFQQADIDAAVAAYRERVREGDHEDLKAMLKKQAFEQHCKLEHETLDRAIQVLTQILLADLDGLFEPQPETDPESLQSDVLGVLAEDAGDSGVGDGWTSEGIAYRLGVEHEVVIATLSSLIDAGKASSYKPKDVDVDLYKLPDLKEQLKGLSDETPDPDPDDAIPDPEDAELSEPGTEHPLQSIPETTDPENVTADMIQKVCDCVNQSSAGISARAISDHSGLQISIVMVCLEELIINSEVNLMGESTYVPYSKDGVDAELIKRIDSVVDDVALILGEMGVALSVMDIAQRLNTNSAVIAHALRQLIGNPVLVEKGIITTSEFNHYLFRQTTGTPTDES